MRTYYFIESLMKFYQEMEIGEVAVMDNDAVKPHYFGGIAKYLAEKEGSGLKVCLTADAKEAVKNADYVVTTIRVGQDRMRAKEERITLNLGIIGQETTESGRIFLCYPYHSGFMGVYAPNAGICKTGCALDWNVEITPEAAKKREAVFGGHVKRAEKGNGSAGIIAKRESNEKEGKEEK